MEFTENRAAAVNDMRQGLREDVSRQSAAFALHLATLEKSERTLRELPFIRGDVSGKKL